MIVVHFANDLMMSSTLKMAAQRLGNDYRLVETFDRLVALPLNPEDQLVVVVDLQNRNFVATEFVDWAQSNQTKIVKLTMYAQHVNEELLAQAQQWNIGTVVTRGQFFRNVQEMLSIS